MRRVVITGLGAVTPIGNNVKELFDNLKKGKCGIDKITHYDTKGRKVKLAGEVKDFDPENYTPGIPYYDPNEVGDGNNSENISPSDNQNQEHMTTLDEKIKNDN